MVPNKTRIFYGIGSIAEGVKETAFNVFLLFYYNNVLGRPQKKKVISRMRGYHGSGIATGSTMSSPLSR